MDIKFTPEQNSFVHLGIEQGRFCKAEDAVQDALALWEKRERTRFELLAEIEAGENSPREEDAVLDSEEDIAQFFQGVEQRGRAKLASTKLAGV